MGSANLFTDSPLQVMREYIQKEHMDKKKKPIDLSDWEDYYDPVSTTTAKSCPSSDRGLEF